MLKLTYTTDGSGVYHREYKGLRADRLGREEAWDGSVPFRFRPYRSHFAGGKSNGNDFTGTGASGKRIPRKRYRTGPVSYTHLDVYKRQLQYLSGGVGASAFI